MVVSELPGNLGELLLGAKARGGQRCPRLELGLLVAGRLRRREPSTVCLYQHEAQQIERGGGGRVG